MNTADIAIVGAGHAGAQAAIMLRELGYGGTIAMIGDEPEPPYERPPLSKEYLAGEKPFEKILLRPESYWPEKQIDLLLGYNVVAVDAAARVLTFEDGGQLRYGKLIWAAGGTPRRLSCHGHDLDGVHTVRNRADVLKMMAELNSVRNVAVVGGGYIGLEAAAVLTKLGKKVVLLEALDRVLARVAGPDLSTFFEADHRAHGVDLRTDVTVSSIDGADGRVTGVRLANDELVPADMVIVGIGIIPSVAPLLAAGADGGNGVLVDEFCRTSLPDVFAIGDCAAHRNGFAADATIRLESVQNANDQAIVAAKAIMGMPEPYKATPWFWSNQYDLRLQTVGLSAGYDQAILRGDPTTRSFSVVYLKDNTVIALDCVNHIRDYSAGRKLVEQHVAANPAILADASNALKTLLI